MKFAASYTIEYEELMGDLECEADNEEDAEDIFRDLAEEECRYDHPEIMGIYFTIRCLDEIEEKHVDPNQTDWIVALREAALC